MRCYKVLDEISVEETESIADGIYHWLSTYNDVLETKIFYSRVPTQSAYQIPGINDILKRYSLVPKSTSVIYAHPNFQGGVHIDYTRNIRLLFPVRNCIGSRTKFFNIDDKYVELLKLDNGIPFYKITAPEHLEFIDELELRKPTFFNSAIPHGVYTDPECNGPRITFAVNFYNSLDHYLI